MTSSAQKSASRAFEEPTCGAESRGVRELAAVYRQSRVVLEAGDRERRSVPLLTRGARDSTRIAIHEGDRPSAGGEKMLDRKTDAAARVGTHRVERFVHR
jgi:hypothetical protein